MITDVSADPDFEMIDFNMLFGMGVSNVRRARKMTQEKLAEITHIPVDRIKRAESGRCKTTLVTAAVLAKALDTSIDELLSISPSEKSDTDILLDIKSMVDLLLAAHHRKTA